MENKTIGITYALKPTKVDELILDSGFNTFTSSIRNRQLEGDLNISLEFKSLGLEGQFLKDGSFYEPAKYFEMIGEPEKAVETLLKGLNYFLDEGIYSFAKEYKNQIFNFIKKNNLTLSKSTSLIKDYLFKIVNKNKMFYKGADPEKIKNSKNTKDDSFLVKLSETPFREYKKFLRDKFVLINLSDKYYFAALPFREAGTHPDIVYMASKFFDKKFKFSNVLGGGHMKLEKDNLRLYGSSENYEELSKDNKLILEAILKKEYPSFGLKIQ